MYEQLDLFPYLSQPETQMPFLLAPGRKTTLLTKWRLRR